MKIILKFGHRPKRRCRLKVFLFIALTAILFSRVKQFSNFGKRALEKYFCEIILKSSHWHGRCRLKFFFFLFLALVAILFSKAEPI